MQFILKTEDSVQKTVQKIRKVDVFYNNKSHKNNRFPMRDLNSCKLEKLKPIYYIPYNIQIEETVKMEEQRSHYQQFVQRQFSPSRQKWSGKKHFSETSHFVVVLLLRHGSVSLILIPILVDIHSLEKVWTYLKNRKKATCS